MFLRNMGCARIAIGALLCMNGETAWAEGDTGEPDKSAAKEIVVTGAHPASDATHLDVPIKDLPISIQTVPRELIRDQGFQRVGDAIRNVSGVVRKEAFLGVTDSFGIRGFDARIGLLNGFRHSFYDTINDLAHVERIEVIKGPASVSSGFLQPGGVVNMVTKAPLAEPLTDFSLTGGSYGKVRAQGDVSHPITDNLRLRVTGAVDRSDSFREEVDARRATLGGALAWDITPSTLLELRAYWLHTRATPDRGFDPDTLGQLLFSLPRSRFLSEPSDTYRATQTDLQAIVNHDLGGGWSIRAGIERTHLDGYRANTQTLDLLADNRTVTREYTVVPTNDTMLNAFAEIHAVFKTMGLEHRLVAGADYFRERSWYDFKRTRDVPSIDIYDPVHTGQIATPVSIAINREVTRNIGIYAQDMISLGDHVKLLAGVRHDWYQDRSEDLLNGGQTPFSQGATTPRIGLSVLPTKSLTLYASYARSFNPQPGTQLSGGGVPKPERGEQYEAGVKVNGLNGRLTASAAIFQITKKNVATTDPNDNDFSILTGEQRSRGLELDVTARPINAVQIITSYALTDAVVTKDTVIPVGNHLLNAPRHQGSFWTRYDIPHSSFGFGAGVFYVGRREAYLPNTFKVPAYTRVDAAIYLTVNKQVDFNVNIQNLTNITYYDSQNSYLYPGAPRTVLATLRFHS